MERSDRGAGQGPHQGRPQHPPVQDSGAGGVGTDQEPGRASCQQVFVGLGLGQLRVVLLPQRVSVGGRHGVLPVHRMKT